MFGLFKKKVSIEKVNQFCDWFCQNNERIIKSVSQAENDNTVMMQVLDEVENELAKIYRDGYKGNIEFEYGFNKDLEKWDLILYHMNNKYLIEATHLIATTLEAKVKDTWLIHVGE
ncbi:MAG: hypothetical protein K2N42_04115 [Anaeroplasmataceae bacterium]|nr:hypothetical protein [Anaeroplasmataceae bacterium]